MTLTRRELLTGIGAGAIGVGGLSLRRDTPRFSRYTYAAPEDDTDDRRLSIAWYERYNGAFVANHAGTNDSLDTTLDPDSGPEYVEEATFVTDATGPVLSVGNVLPGDSGTLVVGLEVVNDDGAEPLDVWFRGSVTDDAENGVNGPERAAGDFTSDGELDDAATVDLSAVRALSGVTSAEAVDGEVVVSCDADAKTAVVGAVEDGGATVENFRTEEASLEDLFLAYTEGDEPQEVRA